MSVPARLDRRLASNRRMSARRKLRLGSTSRGSSHEVLIHNISDTGMLVQTGADLKILEELEVELPEIGTAKARVAWGSDDYFGCQFLSPIPRAAISAALLRSLPVEPAEADSSTDRIDRAPGAAEDTVEEPADSARFSFGVRMRFILGISIALWALFLWAVGLI